MVLWCSPIETGPVRRLFPLAPFPSWELGFRNGPEQSRARLRARRSEPLTARTVALIPVWRERGRGRRAKPRGVRGSAPPVARSCEASVFLTTEQQTGTAVFWAYNDGQLPIGKVEQLLA